MSCMFSSISPALVDSDVCEGTASPAEKMWSPALFEWHQTYASHAVPQVQLQLEQLLLQFCSAERFTPPAQVRPHRMELTQQVSTSKYAWRASC